MVDIEKLKPRDKILHKHWGKCSVVKIVHAMPSGFFGIMIKPVTKEGKAKLALWSGTSIPHYMEGNIRLIKKLDKPLEKK